MKKGERYIGQVKRTAFPNKGIVEIDGETAVVKNGLPGQTVEFAVSKKRNGRCEGRLLRVAEKSYLETAEDCCPHFGICGGCVYQSIPYEEQLKIKEQQVRELLRPVIGGQGSGMAETDMFSRIFEGVKPSPLHSQYRNKMEFSFGDEVKGGPLALGLHKRGSFHDVVNVDHCRIVHPDFTEILAATREYFAAEGIGFYRKLQHTGYLRHLLVRRAVKTGEILAALVTSGQLGERPGLPPDREEEGRLLAGWRDRLLSLSLEGSFAGILHIRNDSPADVIQSDETVILYGQDHFYEELLGLKFKISPFSFFQTNSLGAEVLYETAREYVGDTKGKVVFDLYSGTGTIAQMLAPVAEKVIGVEIVGEAVEAARENAARNGLTNCEFIAGDVMKVLREWSRARGREAVQSENEAKVGTEAGPANGADSADSAADTGAGMPAPDIIILDPPRDGIHPKALEQIGSEIRAERMVYISCKPTSLVRDLEKLLGYGYQAERMCCVDMFPGTGNIETVVSLSQQKPDDVIRVGLDLDELEVTPAEAKATYGEIKAYVKEHTGLAVSSLYIAQVKQKYGIIERENYNKPKSEDARQPKCPADKERAIVDALRHFQMISGERMEAAQ